MLNTKFTGCGGQRTAAVITENGILRQQRLQGRTDSRACRRLVNEIGGGASAVLGDQHRNLFLEVPRLLVLPPRRRVLRGSPRCPLQE